MVIRNTHMYGRLYGYRGVKEGERPSGEYIENGWYYTRRLIALAGYRTADILKKLLPDIKL